MSISGTGPIADRNGPLSVVGYGHNVFSSESEFLKIYSSSNVSIKQMGSLRRYSVPSQHLRQSKTYKIEQPLLFGV